MVVLRFWNEFSIAVYSKQPVQSLLPVLVYRSFTIASANHGESIRPKEDHGRESPCASARGQTRRALQGTIALDMPTPVAPRIMASSI